MSLVTIDAAMFREMMIAAASVIEKNKKILNDMNVFPVPDGDTGINMSLTLLAAAKEINHIGGKDLSAIANEVAIGALKGARGNSGVILSQIIRGFSKDIQGKTELTTRDFANALQSGVTAAYKAVMKPKEGTILTIARAVADEAKRQAAKGSNFYVLMDAIIEEGNRMLALTPKMLPVLAQAGVVDAGGKGLMFMYQGFKMALDGEEISGLDMPAADEHVNVTASARDDLGDIEFGYCTEFFIKDIYSFVTEQSIDNLRDRLGRIGDSLVVVGDKELIKIHVHTNVPGLALQFGLRLGQLSNVKIDNMREQHNELIPQAPNKKAEPEQKEYAVIAVSSGEGLKAIFKDLGVDAVIEGGQSMNPSIEVISNAIELAPSQKIFILPNNKNIILAAQQAAQCSGKQVSVINTKSIPQGIAALLAFNPETDFDTNKEEMEQSISSVKTGQVTYAVRDSKMNGNEIHKGDYIGLCNGDIAVVGTNVDDVAVELIEKMVSEGDDIVTVFYGEGISKEQAEETISRLEEKLPDCEFSVHDGGQPVYSYVISVE
ncbi:MAG: DAK2 domain-containing protein [Christensenellales bacterium]